MNMTKTSLKTTVEWNNVNWQKLERRIFKLQKRIYRASSRGDVKTVRRLQKTLMKSWSGKMLAMRKVSQDNQGKKTAGIDGVKSLTPKERLEMVNNLKLGHKSKPTRRVWIPKPNTQEKRPLGIPTMFDRALQALAKLALEPEWEAKFEPNSHGFRVGRSCHDAIQQIFSELQKAEKYILDADIAKCFDRINHQELLKKLNTYPSLRKQIKAWLKSGVIDNGVFDETETGTPQGGVISPLLANIALHGIETEINECLGIKTKYNQPHLIRYADDLVILHKDINIIHKCQEVLTNWLSPLGLELKPSKTRICHSLHDYNGEKAGFDFLGFNIRQYPTGKAKAIRCKGKNLGWTLTIKPSEESIKRHLQKIKDVIKAHKSAPQSALIGKLNPIIKGWSNYYSTVVSKEIFSYCDHMVWQKLRAWSKRRHTDKNIKFIENKYWKAINGRKEFATRDDETGYKLYKHADTPIKRYVKVQNTRSPYDGDWVYWSSRLGKSPEVSNRMGTLLKKQKGKCNHCKLYLTLSDKLEIDHIIPKSQGGKNKIDNLQVLHRHCHDIKSANDGSYVRDVPMTTVA
jgi:RNA-directed DNA polymerase